MLFYCLREAGQPSAGYQRMSSTPRFAGHSVRITEVSALRFPTDADPELLFAFQIQRQHRVNGLCSGNDHPPGLL